jgi:hypothetical protein
VTRFSDEFDFGLGWIQDEFLARCSHALVVDGGVWIVDPVEGEGVDERIRALGEPMGVLQLLDRHGRDCAAFARRFGIPHYVVPTLPVPFELRVVHDWRWWREVALWWSEPGVLVCGDALGTAAYFVAPGERLGVHPLLRPMPPRDVFEGLTPRHVLCGHGEGVHDGAAEALREALATARRRLPQAYVSALRRRR